MRASVRRWGGGWIAALTLPPLLVSACELFQPRAASAPPASSSAPTSSVTVVAAPVLAPQEPEPEPVATPSAAPEPGVVQGGGPTRGTLPKAAIAEGVERGSEDFERCYLRARRPGLSGVIRVNFVIAPDGSVPHAAALEQGTNFPDDAVIECVLGVFRKLTFPEPRGGRVVSTYPLKFQPLPDAGAATP